MGGLLMNILYIAAMGDLLPIHDVAMPQAYNLNKQLCPSSQRTGIVDSGRTQAADTLHWARTVGQSVTPTPQKYRRRGCRTAPKQFLHFAQSLSLQLALRKSQKQFTLKKLFPKSQSTPANTSNILGRALGAFGATPGLFFFAPALIGGAA
jgi:hypothetical protein